MIKYNTAYRKIFNDFEKIIKILILIDRQYIILYTIHIKN